MRRNFPSLRWVHLLKGAPGAMKENVPHYDECAAPRAAATSRCPGESPFMWKMERLLWSCSVFSQCRRQPVCTFKREERAPCRRVQWVTAPVCKEISGGEGVHGTIRGTLLVHLLRASLSLHRVCNTVRAQRQRVSLICMGHAPMQIRESPLKIAQALNVHQHYRYYRRGRTSVYAPFL